MFLCMQGIGLYIQEIYESPILQNGRRTRIRYGPIRRYAPIRPDTARYAYREVSKNYDLKIKDLIPDTPSDTSRYSVRYFWANNTSFERASGAHQRRPIQVELII